ncbi:MAG TPA: YbhB/YbcL family Raf kinase inhibitor-like protein [Puia sp.]|uniref:YbhB/YbcL family Raf kinase inhibitor-like protein n=1 Tax=Puia sp. TaxID=2045100 RepID=UPI002CFCB122|nr:YbhB/YbcL family Raf kinase inhibitor-like protein [Puia sp.]HVU97092.1 YbhB/YbcL family Raf kinase inhibitor-like protein [Puia sp.]
MKAVVPTNGEKKGAPYNPLNISSEGVGEDGFILSTYTCSGANISPPLDIGGIPEATKSLAIIVDDPDAPGGTWVHWVAWNIAPLSHIKEARQMEKEGINDLHKRRYDGPCPPYGTHHYHFKVYALDSLLSLTGKTSKKDLEQAMQGHILAFGELIALYKK